MDPLIALMVLASAALHPLWNALIKNDGSPEGGFLALACTLFLLGGGQALVTGVDLLAALQHWPLILMSGLGQVVYGSMLATTLRRGDLSTYYPIIRSSPVFIVAVGLVLGQSYPLVLLLGIALVVIGAFFLQFRPGARLFDDPLTLLLALVAMSGIGIYSIADAQLMQVIEPSALFFWVEVINLPGLIIVFTLLQRRAGGGRLLAWSRRPWRYLASGLLAYASYYLILLAFEAGGEVASVAAVRQASIPFSVLIGGLWLKELYVKQRLAASLVLAAGIVIIILTP